MKNKKAKAKPKKEIRYRINASPDDVVKALFQMKPQLKPVVSKNKKKVKP